MATLLAKSAGFIGAPADLEETKGLSWCEGVGAGVMVKWLLNGWLNDGFI